MNILEELQSVGNIQVPDAGTRAIITLEGTYLNKTSTDKLILKAKFSITGTEDPAPAFFQFVAVIDDSEMSARNIQRFRTALDIEDGDWAVMQEDLARNLETALAEGKYSGRSDVCVGNSTEVTLGTQEKYKSEGELESNVKNWS
jgi:hypothetical protein